ncbi:uncharacterized protein LOC108667488 [Hyalella azteca]|uniref:Uncharacterized protein LOC108667488 n=1 Tax=Hyalella azteca TaxID=294128 RepID=A0A8B7N841_HYAAZ|nr:uncharacterized protein LOC108667488 [Hyalella azteca]
MDTGITEDMGITVDTGTTVNTGTTEDTGTTVDTGDLVEKEDMVDLVDIVDTEGMGKATAGSAMSMDMEVMTKAVSEKDMATTATENQIKKDRVSSHTPAERVTTKDSLRKFQPLLNCLKK